MAWRGSLTVGAILACRAARWGCWLGATTGSCWARGAFASCTGWPSACFCQQGNHREVPQDWQAVSCCRAACERMEQTASNTVNSRQQVVTSVLKDVSVGALDDVRRPDCTAQSKACKTSSQMSLPQLTNRTMEACMGMVHRRLGDEFQEQALWLSPVTLTCRCCWWISWKARTTKRVLQTCCTELAV